MVFASISARDSTGEYFATTVKENQLQINSVVDNSVLSTLSLPAGTAIRSVTWIVSSVTPSQKGQKKKRKRSLTQASNKTEETEPLIAVGTSEGTVDVFSPVGSKKVASFSGLHTSPVVSITAENASGKFWSIDASGKVGEWDLSKEKESSSYDTTATNPNFLSFSENKLIIASNAIYLLDTNTKPAESSAFSCISEKVSLIAPVSSHFFSAVSGNRINIIGYQDYTSTVLMAQNNVKTIDILDSTIGVVTENGFVDIFTNFLEGSEVSSRSVVPTVSIQIGDQKGTSDVLNAWFKDDYLVIAWSTGSKMKFEQLKWQQLSGRVKVAKDGSISTVSSSDKSNVSAKGTVHMPANSELPKITSDTPESFADELEQALKANDQVALQACFSVKDEDFVQGAIKRMTPSFSVTLFDNLFARVSQNLSQGSALALWIKWTMITHGGYLVSLPQTGKSVALLHSALTSQLNTVPRLLALQGRLQMLRSQMQLRREMTQVDGDDEKWQENDSAELDGEQSDEGALIVNGEEDFDDDDDDDDDDDESPANPFIEMEAEESEEFGSGDDFEEAHTMEVDDPITAVVKNGRKKEKFKSNGKARA